MNKLPHYWQDARLKKALEHAPDAQVKPSCATRKTILNAATQSTKNTQGKAQTQRWKNFLCNIFAKSSKPWNAAFATFLIAGCVGLLWTLNNPKSIIDAPSPFDDNISPSLSSERSSIFIDNVTAQIPESRPEVSIEFVEIPPPALRPGPSGTSVPYAFEPPPAPVLRSSDLQSLTGRLAREEVMEYHFEGNLESNDLDCVEGSPPTSGGTSIVNRDTTNKPAIAMDFGHDASTRYRADLAQAPQKSIASTQHNNIAIAEETTTSNASISSQPASNAFAVILAHWRYMDVIHEQKTYVIRQPQAQQCIDLLQTISSTAPLSTAQKTLEISPDLWQIHIYDEQRILLGIWAFNETHWFFSPKNSSSYADNAISQGNLTPHQRDRLIELLN